MILPRNWLSRWDWSLFTVAICTVKEPDITVVPAMSTWPVTALVRPTAVLF